MGFCLFIGRYRVELEHNGKMLRNPTTVVIAAPFTDLLIVRDGLGHCSVAVTQVYLPIARARVESLILKTDWTRRHSRSSETAA